MAGQDYIPRSLEPVLRRAPGYVVHPGQIRLPLGPHASALPFACL